MYILTLENIHKIKTKTEANKSEIVKIFFPHFNESSCTSPKGVIAGNLPWRQLLQTEDAWDSLDNEQQPGRQ